MGKNHALGPLPFLNELVAVAALVTGLAGFWGLALAPKAAAAKSWPAEAKRMLAAFEAAQGHRAGRGRKPARASAAGALGVYVKDLKTGEELSWRGDEVWYLASGVKLPIAVELLRQLDEGRISLETRVALGAGDYVDGAGETNLRPPGSLLTVRFLLEQMLIHSDNTASDLLLRLIGLENVNALLARAVPGGFFPITTLTDVRRYAYSGFHSGALRLKGPDFIALKKAATEPEKLRLLSSLLHVNRAELRERTFDEAYQAYYARHFNSASLRSYARLMEAVVKGQILEPGTRDFLLAALLRVETGKQRIRAGLPRSVAFAHKTGTQRGRICDFGIAWRTGEPVLIAACARDFKTEREAEAALKETGRILSDSGLL